MCYSVLHCVAVCCRSNRAALSHTLPSVAPLSSPQQYIKNTFLGTREGGREGKSEKVETKKGGEEEEGGDEEKEEKGREMEKRRDGTAETRVCMRENWRERDAERVRAREHTCVKD